MAFPNRRSRNDRSSETAERAPRPIVAWLCLIGALFPGGLIATTVGPKLTIGRAGVLLLLIPALIRLGKPYRQLIAPDYLVGMIAVWMVGVAMYAGGTENISSATAEAIEYSGGYFVARGFFLGPAAIASFIRVLKAILVIVVLLAIADTLSGQLIVHQTLARLSGSNPFLLPDFRINLVRAAATFEQPILLGTFCAISGAILVSSETGSRRIGWAGLCVFGCFLALSSAPLLSLMLALAGFTYDRAMQRFAWRWHLFWAIIASLLLFIFAVSNHPVGWIISHLTLDPESGYFRLLIWDLALPMIAEEPFTGFAFKLLNDDILDTTIDCVWLQLALRFGIPMIAMLFLANISVMLRVKGSNRRASRDPVTGRLSWGFTTALILFMLTGLTVHYWHYVWIFWGLCLGIRGSLRESALSAARYPASTSLRFSNAVVDLAHARTYGR